MRHRFARLGPLYETPPTDQPPGGPTGDPPPSGSDGGGGTPPPPAGYVPSSRLREEAEARRKAEEALAERQKADDEAKGEWEKVAKGHEEKLAKEKADREAAQGRVIRVARRAALVSAASGKAADPMALYQLAEANGLTDDLDVDEADNVNPTEAEKVITEALKRWPALKATGPAPFGQDRSGAGGNGGGGIDPSKLTPRQKIAAGYEEAMRKR